MKKLLLLLLPVLILTACKDPEDENVTIAKSLVGTYNYTRVGELKITFPQGREQIEAMNTSGIATITYRDGSSFQVALTSDSKDTSILDGYVNPNKDMHFRYYSANYSRGEEFNTRLSVTPEEVVFDNLSILVQETYSGTATIPGSNKPYSGHGLLSLQRQ